MTTAEGGIVLPVYLVVDTSGSLEPAIAALNEGLAALRTLLLSDPVVGDTVRIALVQFSSSAHVVVPLTEVYNAQLPELEASGATNYGAAFSLVHDVILQDVPRLRAEGVRAYRPILFFLTDGSPTDDSWRTSLQELQSPSFRARPTIIAIGFGNPDPSILREVGASGGAFLISDALGRRRAVSSISQMLSSMLGSTVKSSGGGTQTSVQIPSEWVDLGSIPDLS